MKELKKTLHLMGFNPGDDVMHRMCDGEELPYEEPLIEPNIDECPICVVCEDLAKNEGVPRP